MILGIAGVGAYYYFYVLQGDNEDGNAATSAIQSYVQNMDDDTISSYIEKYSNGDDDTISSYISQYMNNNNDDGDGE